MKSAFPDIQSIAYEGPRSKNPFAFKYYQADEMVEGNAMRDHLRFAVVFCAMTGNYGQILIDLHFFTGVAEVPVEVL